MKGEISRGSRSVYLTIIEKLLAVGAEKIILGCTEIPLLITSEFTNAVLFDTTRIHAGSAVEFTLR